jgi:hypothetical protein
VTSLRKRRRYVTVTVYPDLTYEVTEMTDLTRDFPEAVLEEIVLTEDAHFLSILEDAGVACWSGYDECIKKLKAFQEAAST